MRGNLNIHNWGEKMSDIFECSAELIGKFHPLDVRIIGFIVGAGQILSYFVIKPVPQPTPTIS